MSVLGPLARGVVGAGRYVMTAGKITRAARAGATMTAAARAARAARVGRADAALLSRLARDAGRTAPGARILPQRLLDLTAGMSPQQKREIGLNLRTLLELQDVDPRLLRSVTAGSRFPGLSDPAKLLRWLESPEGRQAISRVPESRVYREIAGNVEQAQQVRNQTAREYASRRARISERDAFQQQIDEDFSVLPRGNPLPGTTRQDYLEGRYTRAQGARAAATEAETARAAQQTSAAAGAAEADQTISVLDAMQRARAGPLPVRGLLRELSRRGDERARAFLRSAGKLESPEPVPGKPGLFKIRSRDGRVYELDVRSEEVRNTPTGAAYFGRIEKELGDAGLSSAEVAERVARAGVPLDPADTPLTRLMQRGRMDPGRTINAAMLGTAGAIDLGYLAWNPVVGGVKSAFGLEDTFDEDTYVEQKRDTILRALREQRRARTFVANEARLAALAPDLYNEALAGRRLAPGSRVYGAPQRTDDLMGLLEMMSVGQSRQAFGLQGAM